MVSVEQLIGDLLLRHNCVIIPSFGGFVAKPVAAKIDYTKGTMTPPKKSLLFNRQLINNDGLLINELAQRNELSFDDAAAVVSDIIDQWNLSLKKGGRIELDRVGNLFLDEELNLCFEQDRFFNLLLESFGLGKVHFIAEEDAIIVDQKTSNHTIHPIAPVAEKAAPKEEHIVPIVTLEPKVNPIISEKSTEESKPHRRRPWRYIAAACILPIAFYSIWIPVNTDVLESGMVSIYDFNPFHKRSEASYVKETFQRDVTPPKELEALENEIKDLDSGKQFYSYEFTENTYLNVQLISEKTLNDNYSEEQQSSFSIEKSNYIVGCFSNKSNADNLVVKLNEYGFEARIYDVKNGLHRVTAGTSMSRESYEEIKLKANALGYKGWKLK